MGSVYRSWGRVLYEPIRVIWVCFQSDPYEICFHFSPLTWGVFHADSHLHEGSSVVMVRSALVNLPHGVSLPAPVFGGGENETQVLKFAQLILTSIPFHVHVEVLSNLNDNVHISRCKISSMVTKAHPICSVTNLFKKYRYFSTWHHILFLCPSLDVCEILKLHSHRTR